MLNVPGWRMMGWKVGNASLGRHEVSMGAKESFAATVLALLLEALVSFEGRIGPAAAEKLDVRAILALLLEVFSVNPSSKDHMAFADSGTSVKGMLGGATFNLLMEVFSVKPSSKDHKAIAGLRADGTGLLVVALLVSFLDIFSEKPCSYDHMALAGCGAGAETLRVGAALALLLHIFSAKPSSYDHRAFAGFGVLSGLELRSTTSRFGSFRHSFLGLYVPNLSTGAPPSRCPASPVPVDELGWGASWKLSDLGTETESRSSKPSSRSRKSVAG